MTVLTETHVREGKPRKEPALPLKYCTRCGWVGRTRAFQWHDEDPTRPGYKPCGYVWERPRKLVTAGRTTELRAMVEFARLKEAERNGKGEGVQEPETV